MKPSDRLSDPKTAESRIKSIFSNAKQTLEEMSFSEEQYKDFLILIHYWFGRALKEIGCYNLAKEELSVGHETLRKSIQEGLKIAIEEDDFLFRLGQVEFSSAMEDNPEEAREKAYEYWGKISSQDRLGKMLFLFGEALWIEGVDAKWEGNEEKAKEKFDEAEKAYSGAIASGYKSHKLHLLLGTLYFSKNDYINASARFERLTKEDPLNHLGFYWLGRSNYLIKGKLEEAKQSMVHAIELDPNDHDAHYWLGRILFDFGDDAGASDEYKKSIEIDRNNPKSYPYLVASITTLASKEKEYSVERNSMMEEALRYANVGIEVAKLKEDNDCLRRIENMQPILWNSLAYTYIERGENFSLAIEYIEKALKLDPNNPYYLDTKAWILVMIAEQSEVLAPSQRKKRYDEAEQLLNKCLKSLTTDDNMAKAEAYFHLGYIEKLRGRDDKAREFFLKALEFNPQYDKAKKELK